MIGEDRADDDDDDTLTVKEKETDRWRCISHIFFSAASKNPHKIAVVHASGGAQQLRTTGTITNTITIPNSSSTQSPSLIYHYHGDCCFTYSHLLAAVDSLSRRLRSFLPDAPQPNPITITTDKRTPRILGIYMPPSVEYIVSVLSVLSCGEAFLPLDPSWPKHRVRSLVASSNLHLIISCASPFGINSKSANWLAEECAPCPVMWFSLEEGEGVGKPADLAWPCECESGTERLFCYLMYTSGSTGKPKGVCGTEQGLLNRFWWMQDLCSLHGEELLLFKTSVGFIDHLQEFLSAILTGCTLFIPPLDVLKENVFSLVDFIQAYSIDRLTAVPSLMRAILPTLKGLYEMQIPSSLKLLVLSGETLSLLLWEMLSKILPRTTILNLYGSTEVSGDCTYFDCKRLSMILESESLTSVPIGIPITNCDAVLVGDGDLPNHGEIYVAGLCNSVGYYIDSKFVTLDNVKLPSVYTSCSSDNENEGQLYFRTGDFATRLRGGDLVFLGRKDRSIKCNGQRISLEEIEDTLREHPDVVDAAVICKGQGENMLLVAFIILKEGGSSEGFRSWMVEKLPLPMVPNRFNFTESFPMTSSGKVDYELLAGSTFLAEHVQYKIADVGSSNLLQVIKKVFCNTLMVEKVSDDDDFFCIGGNSIAAAHVAHDLGVDMRLLYCFPSPSKLYRILLERKGSFDLDVRKYANLEMYPEKSKGVILHSFQTPSPPKAESGVRLLKTPHGDNENHAGVSKRMKMDSKVNVTPEGHWSVNGFPWNSNSIQMSCSFSRCNRVMFEGEYRVDDVHQATCSEVHRTRTASMQELWKVHLGSCVDASPLIVFKGRDVYLFIGSHSHEFLCVNARSGSVQWKLKLEGRVECSAAIIGDFSQVVVGCYKGKIYFIDSSNGNILWSFQTSSEVKSQLVVDIPRQLIWCGSHDHNLYALDYKNHCCVYKLPCGGSIYGSPVIDEVYNTLYVASTSGRMTAISVKVLPFKILWLHELEVPVFGSLAIDSATGRIVCCLVDGHVLVFGSSGSIIWKYKISGNIFAGACISSALPSQVLICSRNGSVYSFELEKGNILWKYDVGDPITTSAYVDEHLCLTSDTSLSSGRLVCVCSSSGRMHLIRVDLDVHGETQPLKLDVEEFARLDLQGDVFSSPVMIGGRIFVGCRDDFVHCIHVIL
ncbi:hypothetical protein FNV43_RR12765 [Rhamnella rubrinervis]|uniref:Acyl-activating enzyme 19 n=1 Tax=Rhamnella rubrinervis TaxID=2594499 RepID=A0A8K0MJ40_9ROSA|nr:hypothetical protein FNV43_RR12765 [Rhamnella rubrinervis]